MGDTQIAERSITHDARIHYRLTEAAVSQLMTVLGCTEIADLADRLNIKRQTFWRLRSGTHDIRMSKAAQLSYLTGWPLHDLFAEVDRG